MVNGIDVVRDPVALKATLGYLPEESRLYETMTAEDYLAFFGEIYGIPKEEILVRTRRLFAALSLEPDGKKLGEFSKGMKRKTAIARSLIHDPKFLVYDEATSGLDPMTSRFIAEYLKKLKSEGRTIVLSAHNLFQVEAICDRVMILRRGQGGRIRHHERTPRPVRLDHVHDLVFRRRSGPYRPARGAVPGGRRGACLRCTGDMAGLNASLPPLRLPGGRVERIESRYPSLEEMLVAIGK